METLANLTQTDINNGALNRLLANAGISDVQVYVKKFHQETEDLVLEEFEHLDPTKADDDEQLVFLADIQHWIASFRPRLDGPSQQSLPEEAEEEQQQQQQQLPVGVQGWITGLRPHLGDPNQPTSRKQQQEKQPPTNLTSWMQRIAPVDLIASTNITISETTATSNDNAAVNGNLGIWLNDWSKSLAELPPPTSLDNWLQSLIPKDMHETIVKATSPKGRLNTYLNAAQDVLSEHGYNVSNKVTPPTSVETKTGIFGNVKDMYFLWKTLDKNNDRKITVEDVQVMLQEMGLGFLSKYVAQTLFDMVDSNHDGNLQFRDFIALMSIIKQIISAAESTKTTA